jgi:hypothetical protein
MGKTGSFFRSLLPLSVLLAAVTVLAEQATCTYSNIVSKLVTPTNAVTFTDLRGHTYTNVTAKLTPFGLGWRAQDGSDGRLALTNLDHVVLAEITGLSTSQVAYLLYKKAMENISYIPPEATNRTRWWLEPCPPGLNEKLKAMPRGDPRPTMCFPPMWDPYLWGYDDHAQKDRWEREMKHRMERTVSKEVMRQPPSVPSGVPIRNKP